MYQKIAVIILVCTHKILACPFSGNVVNYATPIGNWNDETIGNYYGLGLNSRVLPTNWAASSLPISTADALPPVSTVLPGSSWITSGTIPGITSVSTDPLSAISSVLPGSSWVTSGGIPWSANELPATLPTVSANSPLASWSAPWNAAELYSAIPSVPTVPAIPSLPPCSPPPCPIITYAVDTLKLKVSPPKPVVSYTRPIVTPCNEKSLILKKLGLPCGCV